MRPHQALLTQGTHQAMEGYGRDVADHRTPFQTEAAVSGQKRITGYLRAHLAIAQDEVRQDGEDRFTRGALDTSDGEPTQANPLIMGVACQTPALAAARLVLELEAKRKEEGQDELDKRSCAYVFYDAGV